MADRFSTQITIGGTFTLTDENFESFESFVSHLQELSPEWGEKYYYLPDITELDETIKDGFIFGCEIEQSGGEFDDIETLCQELGLSYDRRTDPKYELEGEIVSWRAGMLSPYVYDCNAEGKRYLQEEYLMEAMKEHLFNEELASLSDRISNFEKRIKEMLGSDIVAIEPFKLIDARNVVTE